MQLLAVRRKPPPAQAAASMSPRAAQASACLVRAAGDARAQEEMVRACPALAELVEYDDLKVHPPMTRRACTCACPGTQPRNGSDDPGRA